MSAEERMFVHRCAILAALALRAYFWFPES